MAHNKYAFGKFNKELMARAMARDAGVSAKTSIEICNYLRNRKLAQAKILLQEVLGMKRAIPFKRFTDGVGHRRGKIASGRFPQKASSVMLKLLESVETNAQMKGLNTGQLKIIHICAHRAQSPSHYGRAPGREFKRTHIEVVVQEAPEEKKDGKNDGKKAEPKTGKNKSSPDTNQKENKQKEPKQKETEQKETEQKENKSAETDEKQESKNTQSKKSEQGAQKK